MTADVLKSAYQLVAELLLSPEDRDSQRVAGLQAIVESELPEFGAHITEFIADPGSASVSEYVQTLELSPSCPLYLGAHLFDEPSTCSGIGMSGRNSYMLELIGLYGHFNTELNGRELADYLPVVVEFMSFCLDSEARNRDALRRWFLERHVLLALEPLSKSLAKYESPYLNLISALKVAVGEDLRRIGDTPAWRSPDAPSTEDLSLPILNDVAESEAPPATFMSEMEFRA